MSGERKLQLPTSGEKKDPRVVGGVYYCSYWRYTYKVLHISGCRITCELIDNSQVASNIRDEPNFQPGRVWSHYTGWEWGRDRVVSQPESEV